MQLLGILVLVVQTISVTYAQFQYVKLRQQPSEDYSCIIIQNEPALHFRGFSTADENEVKIVTKQAVQEPEDGKISFYDNSKIIEIFAKKKSIAYAHVETLCKSRAEVPQLKIESGKETPEIRKIIDGGDQTNRIDVVFMGDGYQESERLEFFDDITRLTKEMFEGPTFRSYLPLFNIWAIYEASVDSGIGYESEPLNTPFQLFRDAGTLRGIYPGNAAHAREVCQLTGTGGCDYPSIIANDDFYGGLGGEFVISTRSNRTGTVVLRHEMGHNFAEVGEEYDNGQAYYGYNSGRSLDALRWPHWLSGDVREERAIYRVLEYPWKDLSKGLHLVTFASDGLYSRWQISLSVSAAGEADSLEFTLDGEILPWKSTGSDDREFYEWFDNNKGFTEGGHIFTVRSKTNSTNPKIPRMICSIRIHEFGSEDEYHMSNDHISAYPTFDVSYRKTYRPTNAGCLMRNMTRTSFCPICKEGMWTQFLQRISLIDSLVISPGSNPDAPKNVTLNTLKLGLLRSPGNEVEGESLQIRWARYGEVQVDFNDKFSILAETGSWTVSVQFITPEIKADPSGLTNETKTFTI